MLIVLMATHNGAGTQPRVPNAYLNFIPGQGGWQLVVMDNASTDATSDAVPDASWLDAMSHAAALHADRYVFGKRIDPIWPFPPEDWERLGYHAWFDRARGSDTSSARISLTGDGSSNGHMGWVGTCITRRRLSSSERHTIPGAPRWKYRRLAEEAFKVLGATVMHVFDRRFGADLEISLLRGYLYEARRLGRPVAS